MERSRTGAVVPDAPAGCRVMTVPPAVGLQLILRIWCVVIASRTRKGGDRREGLHEWQGFALSHVIPREVGSVPEPT